MLTAPVKTVADRIRRLNPFWALSRTPHGLIDMATPALAALLAIGGWPSLTIIILGLVTVFAGYTAVYALNDMVDYRTDVQKVRMGGYDDSQAYIDGVLIRHPMAKGVLSPAAGLAWTAGWAMVALTGAWLLNPVCLYIFMAGCLMEIAYCLLWRVSPLRSVVNGLVKSCGALAAVFAVTPSPSPVFLGVLLLWIFFWEIGGQNIPNDWTDLEEDRYFKAQTIPVRWGLHKAAVIVVATLAAALFASLALMWSSPLSFGPLYYLAAAAAGIVLLLRPAMNLAQHRSRTDAMTLFNKASTYPLVMFGLVLARLVHQALQ